MLYALANLGAILALGAYLLAIAVYVPGFSGEERMEGKVVIPHLPTVATCCGHL